MGLMKEFKEFAMRGNVMDMAVGIIIGAAFGLIVSSLVNDVMMPPLGLVTGKVDFADKRFIVQPATDPKDIDPATHFPKGEVSIRYGRFINTVINFIIVAFSVFIVVKIMNATKKKEAAAPPLPAPPTKSEVLLTEIRDALVNRRV